MSTRSFKKSTISQGLSKGSKFWDTVTVIDSNFMAVGHSTSPFITAYPWSDLGFGTKFADPATLPPSNGRGVDFTTA